MNEFCFVIGSLCVITHLMVLHLQFFSVCALQLESGDSTGSLLSLDLNHLISENSCTNKECQCLMKSGDSNQTADLMIWTSLATIAVKSAACISLRRH